MLDFTWRKTTCTNHRIANGDFVLGFLGRIIAVTVFITIHILDTRMLVDGNTQRLMRKQGERGPAMVVKSGKRQPGIYNVEDPNNLRPRKNPAPTITIQREDRMSMARHRAPACKRNTLHTHNQAHVCSSPIQSRSLSCAEALWLACKHAHNATSIENPVPRKEIRRP